MANREGKVLIIRKTRRLPNGKILVAPGKGFPMWVTPTPVNR